MTTSIFSLELRQEPDVVLARQRSIQIAELLGFERLDQIRMATAVSEVARNACQYAGGGKVEFFLSSERELCIQVSDRGPGITPLQEILAGKPGARSGIGLGIAAAQRLLPKFEIRSGPDGSTVVMGKTLPAASARGVVNAKDILQKLDEETPRSAYDEIQRQNRDLVQTLEELERSRAELRQINRELEETNRGVVALYAELDEKAEYLRRASDLKTRFLSNMTHEFRTPVNSILSLCRILMDRLDGELTVEQEKQVRYIQKAAGDLSELVNDLLDLAKVEAGKVTVNPGHFAVSDLFSALRGSLRPLLTSNAISLVFEEPKQVPQLYTDEAKVSQILRNLISNALKFTETGEVRVRAEHIAPGQVTFVVSDTGVGIPKEHHQRIFDEFIQLEGPHHQKVRGTGLGLPITKRLTELLGGRIDVSSEPGGGTTMFVNLPIICPGHEDELARTLQKLDPLRFSVLIVDNSPDTGAACVKVFKGTPYQAIPLSDVRQASKALLEFRPIAIIVGLYKQNEEYWKFLYDVKMNPAMQHVGLFVVSDEEDRDRVRAIGATGFVSRPINGKELLGLLDDFKSTVRRRVLLLVDDDDSARYVLRELFRDTRFEVVEAATGREALEKARTLKPVAIFLDLTMPEMDGFQLTAELRADPLTKDVPIVIHSSKSLSKEEQSYLKNNTLAVLSKDDTASARGAALIREALLAAGVNEQQN